KQMAQAVGSNALVLTEALLARIHIPLEWQWQRFTLVISEQFSVLLVGNLEQEKPENYSALNVSLTFNTEAIASFVAKLRDLFWCNSDTYQNLERYLQILAPNDATLQSKFTLLLLEYLLESPNPELTVSPSLNPF